MNNLKKLLLILIITCIISTSAVAIVDIDINLVNQDPDPAVAGDILEIRLAISNDGDTSADNVEIEVLESYPFQKLEGEELKETIRTLEQNRLQGDFHVLKFKLRVDRNVIAGEYQLEILQTINGQTGQKRTVTIDLKTRENAEVIYIDKVKLLPGKITPLTFTINNVGNSPLRDLTFYWENEEDVILPVGSDDTRYIKYIEVGESAELVYNAVASVSAEPDLYKLNLVLTYDDSLTGEEKVVSTRAGIYVGGETDFDVAYAGSTQGETSFSISNIGNVAANSVTVSFQNQQGVRVDGPNSVIIGNLNKGDYTIAGFRIQTSSRTQNTENTKPSNEWEKLKAKQKSGDSNNYDLQIAYTDTLGERHVITKTVQFNPQAQMTGMAGAMHARTSPMDTAINKIKWPLLIVAILLGLVVFKKWKKKKQQKSLKKTSEEEKTN